jgi:hypothetical protein
MGGALLLGCGTEKTVDDNPAGGGSSAQGAGGGSSSASGGSIASSGGGAEADQTGGSPSAGGNSSPVEGSGGDHLGAGGEGANCPEEKPVCFAQCSGDQFFEEVVCTDGNWECVEGIRIEDCPADACFGPQLSGEQCIEGEWVCNVEEVYNFNGCPRFACPTCEGFNEPIEREDCACQCEEESGYVECVRLMLP